MEQTTRKERNEILSTLGVSGVLAVFVLLAAVIRWLETFTPEGTSVAVPFGFVPTELSPQDGLPPTAVDVTWGNVAADGTNLLSVLSLAASIVVGAVAALTVIALFAVLALRFLRGRFFDATNPRLLDAAGWTMFAGALAVYFLDTLGRNGVLAAAGLADFDPNSWVLVWPFFAVWIGATVLGLLSLAFRRGIRLQRDSEGLV
ncbi:MULTISPECIES: hypothetical protein [Microbacterium]|uniref:DUF2975 domain-containing protein n=1 Tax=Microbacterium wangchenii TaxID=2541726 RepID=A0ABX5SQI2_9MICO|nr:MULTISPECIES: hypothetical protein [Microbacterium]MCK6066484.1 hypothetical protein [Microbacterium sp. EYE_512]QBR87441.1 hypothetical protein E4K62_01245 [Microbacterium wangchenii]TXK14763.1 hypothetical protein FVP99_13825 [Microbacterium wangchenii]